MSDALRSVLGALESCADRLPGVPPVVPARVPEASFLSGTAPFVVLAAKAGANVCEEA